MWWLSFVDRLSPRVEGQPSIAGQFRQNLALYLIGGLMLLVQQVLMARRDFFIRDAVDAIGASKFALVEQTAAFILLVSLGAFVARLLSRVTIFTGGRNVEYNVRTAFLSHLHRLGPSFFGEVPTGEIMSRATSDLYQVRLLLGFGVLNVISSTFGLVSALYVMLSVSWKLTAASLSIVPLLMLATRWFSTNMYLRVRENQQAIGEMSNRVLASLAGVRVVRSFAMEDSELQAFEEVNNSYLDRSLRLARLRGSMSPVMGAVSALGILVVFWYGSSLLIQPNGISQGDFVAFWLALLRLIWPMMAIGFVAAIVQRGRAGFNRLKTIFDAEPDVVDGAHDIPPTVRGAIRVHELDYAFGEHQVLDKVSFEVPAGGSLAIVGRTAAGKSTLAALLPRLLPTPPETVFLDGTDICDLPVEWLRASIGYAQQDAFLFSTTVQENIGYALDAVDGNDGPIRAAASEAQVLEDIERLADGTYTVVGERGVQLSGGQKQRVALARALIRTPSVLVLDDPMSAVDAKTEAAILDAIDRQKEERTVLLITHRVAAARRCDSIVVLDHGRIVESGRHEELISSGGIYALFAEEQQMEASLASLAAGSSEGLERART